MIADSYGENVVSNLTLALFEDTGWYKVNYENAQTLMWGKNRGCEFLNTSCLLKIDKSKDKPIYFRNNNLKQKEGFNFEKYINMKKQSNYRSSFPEFCTNFNEDVCSLNKKFRGTCFVSNFSSPLPKDYQYFDDPNVGGVGEIGDYCPYPVEWISILTGTYLGSCKKWREILFRYRRKNM